jgi:hypothetical protein
LLRHQMKSWKTTEWVCNALVVLRENTYLRVKFNLFLKITLWSYAQSLPL